MALEGKQLDGYRILHLIGTGCRGEVYLAEDVETQQQVAMKVVKLEGIEPGQDTNEDALHLFLQEAVTVARFDHPNIQPLFYSGEALFDGSRYAYLITPYCPAGSLETWLSPLIQEQSVYHLTLHQVIRIMQQASEALQYAHDRQIMHLALKPTNFLARTFETSDNTADFLLSDFGVSHLASQSVRHAPAYLAPEQLSSEPVFASDQYALGILAYELLTGQPPFQGTPQSIISAHLQTLPASARELVSQLPPEVDLVLQRVLAKEPDQRFPSVTAFAQAFQTALQSLPLETVLRELNTVPGTPVSARLNGDDMPVSVAEIADDGAELPMPEPEISVSDEEAEAVQDPSWIEQQTDGQDDPLPSEAGAFTATTAPQESRRARSLVATLGMIFLLLIGGGISVSGAMSNWLGLHNTARGQVASLSTVQSTPTVSQHSTGTSTPAHNIPSVTTVPHLGNQVWHSQSSGVSQGLTSLAWADTRFVAVGTRGSVVISPNGQTWTPESSGTTHDLWGIAWSGNILVAVGTGGTILTSPNGVTWTVQHSGVSVDLWSVAYTDGYLFIAIGTGGTILSSKDGITWTVQSSRSGQILDGLVWSGSLDAVVGDNGTILTSLDDGHTWTIQVPGTTQLFEAIAWSKKLFVIVGDNGTILTSPDGHAWTIQHSGTTQNLVDITWTGSLFTAVGDNGTILTSPDGRTWTVQHSGTTQNLLAIAWSGTQIVVTGNNGVLLTSP